MHTQCPKVFPHFSQLSIWLKNCKSNFIVWWKICDLEQGKDPITDEPPWINKGGFFTIHLDTPWYIHEKCFLVKKISLKLCRNILKEALCKKFKFQTHESKIRLFKWILVEVLHNLQSTNSDLEMLETRKSYFWTDKSGKGADIKTVFFKWKGDGFEPTCNNFQC